MSYHVTDEKISQVKNDLNVFLKERMQEDLLLSNFIHQYKDFETSFKQIDKAHHSNNESLKIAIFHATVGAIEEFVNSYLTETFDISPENESLMNVDTEGDFQKNDEGITLQLEMESIIPYTFTLTASVLHEGNLKIALEQLVADVDTKYKHLQLQRDNNMKSFITKYLDDYIQENGLALNMDQYQQAYDGIEFSVKTTLRDAVSDSITNII